MKGTITNGRVTLSEPINGWEGQQVLITILEEEDNPSPSLEEVVDDIRDLKANPQNVIQPTTSLASLLSEVAAEAPIDSAAWNRQWAALEDEMKARDRADNRAEGRP